MADPDKIVNGVPAAAGEFPYMVRIDFYLFILSIFGFCLMVDLNIYLLMLNFLGSFAFERIPVWRFFDWPFARVDSSPLLIRVRNLNLYLL